MKYYYTLLFGFVTFSSLNAQTNPTDEQYRRETLAQRQEIRSNIIQLQNLEIDRQQEEINRQRRLNRMRYEQNTIKNPENDFKEEYRTTALFDDYINVRLKEPKYKVRFAYSPYWNSLKRPNDDWYFVHYRKYSDDSYMMFVAGNPVLADDTINEASIRSYPLNLPTHSFGFTCDSSMSIELLNMQYPAEENGLKINDKILSVDGVEVSSKKDLANQLKLYSDDDTVQFVIQRKDEVYNVSLTPQATSNQYYGDIEVSGYPAFYWITEKEKHIFGKNERAIQVNTAVFVEDQIFHFVHIFNAQEDPRLFDSDFHRYRELMLLQLRRIQILPK